MLGKFRKIGRKFYDSFYCKNIKGKIEIGVQGDPWVITENFPLKIIYSGGVGKNISFELELIEKYNSLVYIYDPSPTGIKTINELKVKPRNLLFHPIGLNKKNEVLFFSFPKNPDEGSFYAISSDKVKKENVIQFECQSISNLMKVNGHAKIDLLKIDIEGAEYGVIDDILENQLNIKQICLEFHHFFQGIPRSKTKRYIKKLNANGYTLFHKVGTVYSFIKLNP
jgi:FkbM family methyltransferase